MKTRSVLARWMVPALLALAAAVPPVPAQELKGPQDVAAMVNGQVISRADLEREVLLMEQQILQEGGTVPDDPSALEDKALESLIDQELLYQESRKQGYAADPVEVEEQVAEFRDRFPDPAIFNEVLGRLKHTPETFRDKLEHNLTVQRYVETGIASGVVITEAEARTFFEGNPQLFERAGVGFEQARPSIEEHLRQAHVAEAVSATLQRLRMGAVIEKSPQEPV